MVFIAVKPHPGFCRSAQRGGYGTIWLKKCGEAAFRYMPHSAVVISCESARLASDAGETRRTRATPPKQRGGM